MVKRILVIGLTERMGGVETFIYNTTKFSDKNKYVYDFLVHGADRTVFQKKITEFYNNEKHFFFVPNFKKHPIKALRALYKFYKVNGNKYDFVHLETGATSEIVYVFPFCLFNRFKVIVHSHNGNGYSPFINFLFRPLVNITSSIKLACSIEAAKWLFGEKKLSEVRIINNGIDTDRFTFNSNRRQIIRNHYQIDDNTILIGHIGRFSEQKNHQFIIKVFSNIKKKHPNSKLMLLGVGELQTEVKQQIIQLGLENDVIFCGLQSNTEDFYSAFDVFLMPSLYEGLPIVGIEAQSEGLPCFFSSNISKLIKITDNANILSLEMSPSTWANKILKTHQILQERENYSKTILDKGFSIKSTVKELEKIYENG